MQSDANDGKESIESGDLIVPRVTLLQGISPPVMQGLAQNGTFWHTINEESLGDAIRVVVVHHSKRYTLWNPLHLGGGVIARASDGKHWDTDFDVEISPYKDRPKHKVRYSAKKGDPVGRDVGLGRWGTTDPENEDSGPAATLSHVFVCRALDMMGIGPFVVFMQRSSEPVARQLLTKVQLDNAPLYGQVYKMSSRVMSNAASQEYNQYTFIKDGYVPSQELYEEFKLNNTQFSSMTVKTNDDVQDEVERAASTDTGSSDAGDKGDDKY